MDNERDMYRDAPGNGYEAESTRPSGIEIMGAIGAIGWLGSVPIGYAIEHLGGISGATIAGGQVASVSMVVNILCLYLLNRSSGGGTPKTIPAIEKRIHPVSPIFPAPVFAPA